MKKYLILLLSFFFIFGAFNTSAQQSLERFKINDFSKGMNSFDSPDILEVGQGASMVNVVLNRFGVLSKRKGQDLFNLDVGNTAFTGIGRFDPDRTTSYLMAASGTDIIASLSSDTSWSITNAASQLTTGKDTEFVQANNFVFVLNGFENTSWWNGSIFVTGGYYPASPPSARTGAWLRNYLFLGGATTETDWIYFSNNLEPHIFDATDIIKINTGDGQAIQKLIPYRLNELIIYKERSIFVLDITGSTPLSDWTVQPISKVVGTPAPRTVVSLGNDQWFLSSEPVGIRSLQRTEFDKILVNVVSRPIQDIFENTGSLNLNKTEMDKSAAILFDNKYIIGIPTGTSTVNNTVLVHDFLTGAWYIIDGWYPAAWVEFNNRLYYIDANDGRVIQCFTGTTGDYPEGPNFIDSSSSPTNGIDFEFISRTIDFDKEENFKESDSIEVEFDPTGNYEAIVYVNLDNTGWASLGSVDLSGSLTTLPQTLPFTLSNAGIARKTFQMNALGEWKKMQVRVAQIASQATVALKRITIFADPKKWRRQ